MQSGCSTSQGFHAIRERRGGRGQKGNGSEEGGAGLLAGGGHHLSARPWGRCSRVLSDGPEGHNAAVLRFLSDRLASSLAGSAASLTGPSLSFPAMLSGTCFTHFLYRLVDGDDNEGLFCIVSMVAVPPGIICWTILKNIP